MDINFTYHLFREDPSVKTSWRWRPRILQANWALGLFLILNGCALAVLAADTGWLQPGVRVWYVGGVSSGPNPTPDPQQASVDAETAVVIDRFENGAAYLTQHSAVSYWTSPMPASQVISPDAAAEGAFWINPARLVGLQPAGVFPWKGQVCIVSRAAYTPTTLPFLYLLPEAALFELASPREIITLTFANDTLAGDYFFDVLTGLLLSQTERLTSGGEVTTTMLTLSEINYDFAHHTAFAEDGGLHTAFGGHYSAVRNKGFGLGTQGYQLTPAILSRYINKVLFRHTGILSDTSWLAPLSFSQYVSYDADRQEVYLSDDGTNWVANGDHIYLWIPPADRSASQIRVWDIDLNRVSAGYFAAPVWPTVPGFNSLTFDSSGYVSDMYTVWPALNFYVDSSLDTGKINRLDGLSYYQNTMQPARPASESLIGFDSAEYSVSNTAGHVTLTVVRTNGTSGSCSVNYATSNGTAYAGTDYTSATGALSWADGESAAKTITIAIANNGAISNKTFAVTLQDALGAVLGWISGATVTIQGTGNTNFHVAGDFDGDGRADPVAIDASGNWYIWFSAYGYNRTGPYALGNASATPLAADFDGDSKADPAGMDGSGNWIIWMSGGSYSPVGPYPLSGSGTTPVAADFDGDGRADPAAVDSSGNWTIWMSSGSYAPSGPYAWGASGTTPLAADFDGDRRADPAAVDSSSNWIIRMSGSSYAPAGPYTLYAGSGTTPVAADFDGDGRADPAAANQSGNWTIWMSSAGYAPQGPYALPMP